MPHPDPSASSDDPRQGGRFFAAGRQPDPAQRHCRPPPRRPPRHSNDEDVQRALEQQLVDWQMMDAAELGQPPPNRQDSNVGNRGDIRKHAAVQELVLSLPECLTIDPRRGVLWIDTHAYQLLGTCPDPHWWVRDLDHLPEEQRDGYQVYRRTQIEAGILRDGCYRCSSELARLALAKHQMRHRAVLGETHSATRSILERQVSTAGWSQARIVADATQALATSAEDVDLVIVLVDSFTRDADLRSKISTACERWTEQGPHIAVGIYDYQPAGPTYSWAMALSQEVCLGTVIDDGPHRLAWYGSGPPEIEGTWVDMLAMVGLRPLGWRSPGYGVA